MGDRDQRVSADEIAALRRDRARLEDLGDNLPGAMFQYVLRPDGTDAIAYMSPGSLAVWGIAPAEAQQDPSLLWQAIHPDDVQGMQRSVMASAESLEPWAYNWRVTTRDGAQRWLRGSGTPRRTPDGGVMWNTLVVDMTDQMRAQQAVEATLRSTIGLLNAAVEARDPYTAGHQSRVGDLALRIGRELGLDAHLLDGIEMAARVHDVGKLSVPAEILGKPGPLSDVEFALVKTHAARGAAILKDVPFEWPIADIVHQHHERIDGSGYPRGLAGTDILIEARIIGVADTIDAMTSHRPYRSAPGMDRAVAEIRDGAGVRYDAEVAAVVVDLVERGEVTEPDPS